MDHAQQMDLLNEVQLPTQNQWVNVSGSPFQVMTRDVDEIGIFWMRVRPAYAAYWTEFMSNKEAGDVDVVS